MEGRPCCTEGSGVAWLYAHSTRSPLGRVAVSPGDNTLALKAHVGCGRLPLSLASSDEAEGLPSEKPGVSMPLQGPQPTGQLLFILSHSCPFPKGSDQRFVSHRLSHVSC